MITSKKHTRRRRDIDQLEKIPTPPPRTRAKTRQLNEMESQSEEARNVRVLY